MTLRCVIVDDSPAVRCAARDLLEGEGVTVVGVAASVEGALALMEELAPDVMLVDIDLGPESGFDLARRLTRSLDRAPVRTILTSTHDEADFADLIAASPAIGFLPKSDLSAAGIRRLLAGPGDEAR
jgi:DNA-binding NarL/FixJ family response regulator